MDNERKIEDKVFNILHKELPGKISSVINNVNYEKKEIETEELNNIYNQAKYKLMEMLIDEYGLPESEVSEFVDITIDDNKDYVQKIIAKSREDKNMGDINDISNNTQHIAEMIGFNEQEMADNLNEFNNKASNKISEIVNEDKNKTNTLYQISGVAMEKTKSEFKKWINVKTLGDEEVAYRVNSVLNSLDEKLGAEYLETSDKIQDECIQKITSKIEEAINECCQELNKEVDSRKEETQDVVNEEDKEEIVDRIVNNAEAFKERNEEVQRLENEVKFKSAADYFK